MEPYDRKRFDRAHYYLQNSSGGPSVRYELSDSLISLDKYTISSVRTPGFRFKKRYDLPMNDFSFEVEKLESPMTSMYMVDDYGSFQMNHTFHINLMAMRPSAISFVELQEDGVDEPLRRELLKKLNTSKSSILVTAAEGHKTFTSVTRTVTKIAGAITHLRNFNFPGVALSLGIRRTVRQERRINGKFKRFTILNHDATKRIGSVKIYDPVRKRVSYVPKTKLDDFLSDAWLEYSYGWKPLLSDVKQQTEALAETLIERSGQTRYMSVRVKRSVKKSYVIKDEVEPWVTRKTITIETSGKMGVNYSMPSSSLRPLNTFGLLNPAVVAWELVPFSFVADWFLPIGSFLESLTATIGLDFHSGYLTRYTHRKVTASFAYEGVYKTPGRIRSFTGVAEAKYEDFPFSRARIYNFPTPPLPSFEVPDGLNKSLSAIALLQSLFLRKK